VSNEDDQERAVLLLQEGNARWLSGLDADARRDHTAPAREAYLRQLMREIDPDGTLPPAEVAFRAKQARRAALAQISRLGVEARLRNRELREQAAADAALGDLADAMAELDGLQATA
jgi:hypothetical protein